jgi:peptidoglycan/LPS O-acetylase OafA/YrhL
VTATVGPAPDARPATSPPTARFRDDIQGLRAVAVILVLGYHAGIPQLTGGFVGVDVFFVISGYLITGLLLREVERTGTVSLRSFYARRARRLLPATAVVLVATAAITVLLIPATRWAAIARDLAASALYVTNWWMADQAVDYLAAPSEASPVQHFWTLAVEEQFYVLWPLLLLVLVLVHRRTGWHLRSLLFGGIAVLAAGSFLWSVHLTAASPGRAYFVTTTRAWELAVGAMLAFGVARAERLRAATRTVLAVAGSSAVLLAAFTFDAATPFPSWTALLPTVGTAAIIAAGTGAPVPIVGRPLTTRSMRAIGGLSYSLYLWHWPLLVGARAWWAPPGEPLSLAAGTTVVLASVIPAWLTFRFVEAPIHHAPGLAARHGRNAVLAVACTLIGTAAAVAVAVALPAARAAEQASTTDDAPAGTTDDAPAGTTDDAPAGDTTADAAVPEGDDGGAGFTPGPIEALEDRATLDGEPCIQSLEEVPLAPCTYGPAGASTKVAVVGDSKMHQWLPAIERIADARGWQVVTYLKSGCPLVRVPVPRDRGVDGACREHNDLRYEALLGDDLDLVLTSQRLAIAVAPSEGPGDGRSVLVDDLRRTWRELTDRGVAVTVVLDNPDPGSTVPDCLVQHLDDVGACGFPRSAGVGRSAAPVQLEAADDVGAVRVVDLTDRICPGATCPPVIGRVLVYRQGSHLTSSYVTHLAPELDVLLNGDTALE